MKTLSRPPVLVLLLVFAALCWPARAGAQTVPFKVYLTKLVQLDAGVDPVLGLLGDYYAKVTIDGMEQDNRGACDGPDVNGLIVPFELFEYFGAESHCGARTPWVFTRMLTPDHVVHVAIQIYDEDAVFDDEADAIPGPNKGFNLYVDPSSGQWTGDYTWPQDCSRPNQELGGNNVDVCFQAGFDRDDDGLLDSWEQLGVDTNNDGAVDLNLAALGANPMRKDVFVEADYMVATDHTHAPLKTAIERAVNSFVNAPLANPDGTTGVQLHVDVGYLYGVNQIFPVTGPGGAVGTYGDLNGGGNYINETGNETLDAFGQGKGSGTAFADLESANFSPTRVPVFRYMIFGHQTNARTATNDCTSGVSDGTGRAFFVTLGGVNDKSVHCWETDAGGHSIGSASQQAGTFLHELGHALGLQHGGNVPVNMKPNYLSVMNYAYQACGIPLKGAVLPDSCDYSRLVSGAVLPDLNETSLDECTGLGTVLGFGSLDWNADGIQEGVSRCGPVFDNVSADINNDGICIRPGPNQTLDTTPAGDDDLDNDNFDSVTDGKNRFCDTTVKSGTDDQQVTARGFTPAQPPILSSYDDWDNLHLSLIGFAGVAGGGAVQEPNPETLQIAHDALNRLTAPAVAITDAGPATGKPGDVLTYTLTVTNTGHGPALATVLHTTSPDGTTSTSDLDVLVAGASTSQLASFTVPANACPGDLNGAGATLTFRSLAGDDLTAAAAAPLQILDVAPPALDVTVSPGALWPPNHTLREVTATVTASDNCDAQLAVTLVSITSNEAAVGVIGNGDQGPDVEGAATGTDDRVFSLRAERGAAQGSTGRVYTITYRATDASGNSTTKSATVTVPLNSSGR